LDLNLITTERTDQFSLEISVQVDVAAIRAPLHILIPRLNKGFSPLLSSDISPSPSSSQFPSLTCHGNYKILSYFSAVFQLELTNGDLCPHTWRPMLPAPHTTWVQFEVLGICNNW